MALVGRATRRARLAASIGAIAFVTACDAGNTVLPVSDRRLALGTWGGENAGVIVSDSLAHVHVGCTFGDIPGPIPLDSGGRFSVNGSYMLRAFPIAVGPSLPAQFAGRVDGVRLTFTVTVNDTVENKVVVLGPTAVMLGQEPRMGPCPICRPPLRASM
jgi:hypothetical protein